MPLFEKKGSILDADEDLLCFSCSVSEKQLIAQKMPNLVNVYAKYPYANVYKIYKETGNKFRTGSIKVCGSGAEKQVVALFTQFYSGLSFMPNDTVEKREKWFQNSLQQLSQLPKLDSLAFDYGNLVVDCGYSAHQIKQYLEDFCDTYQLHKNREITIILYRDPKVATPPASKKRGDIDVGRKKPASLRPKAKPVVKKSTDQLDLKRVKTMETVFNIDDFCKYQIVDEFGDDRPDVTQLATDPSWSWLFSDSSIQGHLHNINKKLGMTIYEDDTFPVADEIFNAFNYCHSDQLSVVILGQDPYPTRGNAHGLSFSAKKDMKIPKSLHNIYAALVNDEDIDFVKPKHPCLVDWAKQGVLLLNAALTVKESKPGEHLNIWTPLTDRMIELISQKKQHVVFILWGLKAKNKKKLIDSSKHCILEFNHPSSRVAGNSFGKSCKNFSETNAYLTKVGKKPIDWQISE